MRDHLDHETSEAPARFTNVRYAGGGGFTLLLPDLALAPGRVTAAIGGNGAGKTTLLSLLLGLIRPASGRVTLLGEAPAQADRRRIGVQLQEAAWSQLYRVADIIALHRESHVRHDPAVFALFGAPEIAGKRYGQLSSGQRQRLHLALALGHEPDFAIFDEPTSNLDPAYAAAFREALTRRPPPCGALVVTHDGAVAETADDVLELDFGRVAAHGPRAAVLAARFGAVACRFEGDAEALTAIDARLSAHPAVSARRPALGARAYYGAEPLREAARAVAASPGLSRFALWTPTAADLLEDLADA